MSIDDYIEYLEGEWYFYDEYGDKHGPYADRQEAIKAWMQYHNVV